MKKLILLAALAATGLAHAKFYVGLEPTMMRLKFEEGYGHNIFPKNYYGINAFAGYMFNKHFGLEAGYEHVKKKKGTVSLGDNEVVGGVWNNPYPNPHQPSTWNYFIKQRYPYVALTARTNVFDDKTSVIANAGLVFSKMKANYTIVKVRGNAVPNRPYNFNKEKVIPMLKLGLARNVLENLELKVTANWKNTKKLKLTAFEHANIGKFKTFPKNSWGLGLGICWVF